MLVYLVRHAHSLGNAKLDTGLNSGLSPLGLQQAEALERRLDGSQFTAIYSSPFRRCLETALPIARRLNLPVRLRPELCEYHGLAPGSPPFLELVGAEQLAARHSSVIPCPDCPLPLEWPPIDEPLDALVGRSRSLARFLKDRWQGENDSVFVVGHGSPIARLIEAWLTDQPGPSFRFVIDNATISLLRYRRGVSSLLQLNDTSHLTGCVAPDSPFATSSGAPSQKGAEW